MVRLVFAAICSVAVGVASAAAQPYPSRPISLIVPYPAGGPLDQVARVMTEHMRGTLGQPFVIENVSGAGGSIGVGRVARATPNGYTIGIGDVGTQVLNGAVYPLTYDVMTDFDPVALLVASPLLVLSRNNLPAKTLAELVAWLKANQEESRASLAPARSGVSAASTCSRRSRANGRSCRIAARRRRSRIWSAGRST